MADQGDISKRLGKYTAAKRRAVEMQGFLEALEQGERHAVGRASSVLHPGARADLVKARTIARRAQKLQLCGCRLTLRDYYTVGQVRLMQGLFCKQPLLCPLCAIRRAAKFLRAHTERVVTVLSEAPQLRPYLVTRTVANGPDLAERFLHLRTALQAMTDRRRMYLNGKSGRWTEAARALAGVGSIEIKRGKRSGEWHPHHHAVWLCEEPPDADALSREWHEETGDSYIVDVRPFKCSKSLDHLTPAELRMAIAADFCEVAKYSLKFSELELADNWHAFNVCSKRRLVDSFGWLYNVEVDPSLLDEPLEDEDLPYLELLAKFEGGAYHLTQFQRHDLDHLPPERVPSAELLEAVAAAEASFLAPGAIVGNDDSRGGAAVTAPRSERPLASEQGRGGSPASDVRSANPVSEARHGLDSMGRDAPARSGRRGRLDRPQAPRVQAQASRGDAVPVAHPPHAAGDQGPRVGSPGIAAVREQARLARAGVRRLPRAGAAARDNPAHAGPALPAARGGAP